MKLTTGIVVLAMTAGTVWAQKPAVIQSTRTALQGVQQQRTAASNAALQAKPSGAVAARPAPTPAVAPTKTQVTFKAQPVAKKPARAEHKHAGRGSSSGSARDAAGQRAFRYIFRRLGCSEG